MRFAWDGYVLDLGRRTLLRDGRELHVEPRVFELLAYLIERRDRVVLKNDLLDALWGSRFVSESALTTCVKEARKAVGDSGRAQHTIRTAHGAGYQFLPPVEIERRPASIELADGVASAVPVVGNAFVGRDDDLAALAAAHDRAAVVSIVGPAGVGKTRLCVEWLASDDRPASVAFVSLAEIRDEAAVDQAVAQALAMQPGDTELLDAIGAFLRSAPYTLVLDNCEHLLGRVRIMIDGLLDAAPGSRFVVTSREPLGRADEVLVAVGPLPVDAVDGGLSPAVALFHDRARRVVGDFASSAADVDAVPELCAALDGLPLVIELAASRMGTFGVSELVARLDHRLDLLGGPVATRGGGRSTLRDTLAWSYELLEPDERRLFRHLAAFPAGAALDGLEWLAADLGMSDPWTPVSRLVDTSLVVRTHTEVGSWFSLYETMRAFGLDQLDAVSERTDADDRVAAWALELTATMDRTIRSDREVEWNGRIRRELGNLRAARQHLVSAGRFADAVCLSMHLDEWARPRNVSEIWDWSEEAVGWSDRLDPVDRARVSAIAAGAAWQRGRLDEAKSRATEALESPALDEWTDARASTALAAAEMFSGDPERASALWQHRVTLDDYLPDAANVELARAYLGDAVPALESLRAIFDRATESNSPSAIAWTHYVMGEVGALVGDPEHRRWLEQAIETADSIGGSFIRGVAGVTLAGSLVAVGETEDAARTYSELITHWLRNSAWTQLWTTLRNVAELLSDHDPHLALTLIETADRSPHGAALSEDHQQAGEALVARLTASLGGDDRMWIASADHVELATMAVASLGDLAHDPEAAS